jgi:hypothetical protein
MCRKKKKRFENGLKSQKSESILAMRKNRSKIASALKMQ